DSNFPYIEPELAEYIATRPWMKLNVLGIDSFSIDPRGSNSEAHRALLSRDILILETAVNLKELKNYTGRKPFELHCVPVAYPGADAGQTRAYARL
ncbi:MAG: hypothetical protein ABIG30_03340, partial [Candidatus Aenigmatarchaeota archaeon]